MSKLIVMDANILIRGVLGKRVPQLLEQYGEHIRFFTAKVCYDFEEEAKRRIGLRDERDWPLLALALALDCPVWTEDNDFFGTGVVTWHTQNVEIYLSG